MSDVKNISVVVVDDDPGVGRMIVQYLAELKLSISVFTDPAKCLAFLESSPADIVITDLGMPCVDGLTVLQKIKKRNPATEVIVITGSADKDSAIKALKLGAFDFFEKPIHSEQLIETIKRTIRYQSAVEERDRFKKQLNYVSGQEAKRWGINAFIGQTDSVKAIFEQIRMLQATANTSVLIIGESGTGKELVARAVHFGSCRSSFPFVAVNCSAMPKELAESILFGHVRGAFTGAIADKQGAFENAHEGTLFLDEIGDMPAEVQAKLLRVLDDNIIVPVGKSKGRHVNVRIVAATNADLQRKITNGTFRSDLFYRLSRYTIELPTLRSRKEDIPLLVAHYAGILAEEMGMQKPKIEPEVILRLQEHDFPGNVRELKNMIERALITCGGRTITTQHLHFTSVPEKGNIAASTVLQKQDQVNEACGVSLNLHDTEKLIIQKALDRTKGNVSEAARIVGISRPKLYKILKSYQSSAQSKA